MRIVELDAGGVETHVAELAQLLLDAHAAGMALGLAPSLTVAGAEAAWLEVAGDSSRVSAFSGPPSTAAGSSVRFTSLARRPPTAATAPRSSGWSCAPTRAAAESGGR